eukprot:TRINITY_DN7228_c0_g1_i2.p1 TRINITY_DN7228_c0_g1~~TRINITY_DN7228_c0_g1_i2.p1  ORF type:complete len:211 (-),score=36.62 TRINITY_DN7228_c0_g1_i2:218-850(-)
MGSLQLFTIFLIVHDIDPNAHPITSVPDSPWKQTTWTINCMKWMMTVFLVVGLVPEVADNQEVCRAILTVDDSRLDVSVWAVWTLSLMHYIVTLSIIWGGVNAICSFSAVPDIVYSSLAITFISHVDDAAFQFFKRTCDVKAEFDIEYKVGRRVKLPNWVREALRMFLILPCFWGFFLISRAWHTNVMPAGRVRFFMSGIDDYMNQIFGH